MKFEEELFLEQYKQVWEQRRQHVGLYWSIPPISVAVLTLVIEKFAPKQLSDWPRSLFVSLILFAIGIIMLFLRHNFFVAAHRLLLEDLQKVQKPMEDLPQSGEAFQKRYCTELGFDEQIGSYCNGMFSWAIIIIGLVLFIYFCLLLPNK